MVKSTSPKPVMLAAPPVSLVGREKGNARLDFVLETAMPSAQTHGAILKRLVRLLRPAQNTYVREYSRHRNAIELLRVGGGQVGENGGPERIFYTVQDLAAGFPNYRQIGGTAA